MNITSRSTITFLLFIFILVTTSPRIATVENKVVVVPLGSNSGPPVPVAKSGQTTSYYARNDGALEKGTASPKPRFIDNNDGTVSDRLTDLVWLKEGAYAMFFHLIPSWGMREEHGQRP